MPVPQQSQGAQRLETAAQVWAVAFACVVAFMGIGLVDPILPAIADSLKATPVETELLFTSYLVVTGLAMLITSWISSRIGAKATLLVGLGLIVVFAFFCAISGSVDAVIGFRAGWGLGNALFISTALATIVGGRIRRELRRDHPLRSRAEASASPWDRCSAASWVKSAGVGRSSASSF